MTKKSQLEFEVDQHEEEVDVLKELLQEVNLTIDIYNKGGKKNRYKAVTFCKDLLEVGEMKITHSSYTPLEEEILMENEKEIVLDLNNKQLNEDIYAMMGAKIKIMLRKMFGWDAAPAIKIKGKRKDVDSFMNTLSKEKRYMDSYMKNGLHDPKTIRDKWKLKSAVSAFERQTGLKWPFKQG